MDESHPRGQGEAAALHSLGSHEGAGHLLAGGAIAPADAALVELLVGADGAVATGLHALALHAHRRGVGAARGAIHHLGDTRSLVTTCTALRNRLTPRTNGWETCSTCRFQGFEN